MGDMDATNRVGCSDGNVEGKIVVACGISVGGEELLMVGLSDDDNGVDVGARESSFVPTPTSSES